ncbi:MAG: M48 family metalloprotease [Phycisphaerales bacterium]|nr:M48 family metalloprotease [Phycisphaerales bacterium]
MHLLIIALAAGVFIHDAQGRAALADVLPPSWVFALSVGPLAAIALFVWAWQARCGRLIDRTGSSVYVGSADASLTMSRLMIVGVQLVNVLALGWLDVVRDAIGDSVLVDEAVATAPALLAIAAGWAAHYPIDARLRQARLFAAVERGETVYPPRTLGEYLSDQFRHQMLIVLLPIGLLMGWSETLTFLAPHIARWMGSPVEGGAAYTDDVGGVIAALQLAGALVVLSVSPLLMRHVWSTVALGPGALRDRLQKLCDRHGVRHRGLLVWRTHGSMINGAVMGLFGRLRYILLTDALLDSLPDRQIEAVMAHEIAHVKERHLPWLMGVLLASVGLAGAAVSAAVYAGAGALGLGPDTPGGLWTLTQSGATIFSAGVGLWVFGGVSRAFERQADAFAVKHLSGMSADPASARSLLVTPEAAQAMIGALDSVADLNHVPRRKFTWRHGSIADRQRSIAALVGRPAAALPIDRRVRTIKLLGVAALLALAALTAAEFWLFSGK